jgi:hypothetical protein
VAGLLGGSIVWQNQRNGLWAAVIQFPTAQDAHLDESAPAPVQQ